MSTKVTEKSINSLVKSASYAVRGKIVTKAGQLSLQLKDTSGKKLPFTKIISCNIGNPHSLEQKPISFVRDVLSVVVNPSLKDRLKLPADVISRADRYLKSMPGMGAYTESQGLLSVREDVAKFLGQRDGFPGDPSQIFLTNGASEGARLCMQTIIRSPAQGFKDGLLTPIPQYPMYSALTTLLEGFLVPYHLDESKGWSCTVQSLRESLKKAKSDGISTRALVVINPGNPTGQVLDRSNMRDIVQFCAEEGICLFADEVYQENIWRAGAKFESFRKIVHEMGIKSESQDLQLISFHSISKGFLGECGLRGGYFELFGIPEGVKQEIYKLASISLCSNTAGQIVTGIMVNPPVPGDESHSTYAKERDGILQSMKRRAEKLSKALNSLEGMSCTTIDGAMYAFPTIKVPPKALIEAQRRGVPADEMYCMSLLEETGIVVVPGSGFGQVEGTSHFRTTILPPEESMEEVIQKISVFHNNFMKKYL